MSEAVVLIEKEPPLGWLIFNRPDKLNAFNAAMAQAIPEGLKELEDDPAIRVVIVRGAGEKAFSAGADISDFDPGGPAGEGDGSLWAAFRRFAECHKPTVAMIHGVCMGGGCAAALNIDIRLASEDARFAITPARLGLGYAFEGVERAVEELGPANARYLLITANRLNAEQALAMGLVQEVHPAAEIEAATRKLATQIAENAPRTIRAIRESVRQSVLDPAGRRSEVVEQLIRDCFESEDFKEGVRAFAEKRKPRFEDR